MVHGLVSLFRLIRKMPARASVRAQLAAVTGF
jgi:hypothetical protein